MDQENKDLFNQSISAFESLLIMQQPESLEEILSLFRITTGNLWQFIAQLNGYTQQKTLGLVSDTGAMYQLVYCLQKANIFLNEQRFIIPATFCKQSDLNTQSNNIKLLFTELIHRLDNAYHELPKNDRLVSIHILILNRLTAALCNEIVEDGCQISKKRISLTPICKFRIAWSTHFSNKYFSWL